MSMDALKLVGSLLFSIAITSALMSALDEDYRLKCLRIFGIKPVFAENATIQEVFRLDFDECSMKDLNERHEMLIRFVYEHSRFPATDGKRLQSSYKTAVMALVERDVLEGLSQRRNEWARKYEESAARGYRREAPKNPFESVERARRQQAEAERARTYERGQSAHSQWQGRQRYHNSEQRPAPKPAALPWRSILGVSASERDVAAIKLAYRRCAKKAHPDKGGSNEAMARVNKAFEAARAELGFV